MQPGAGAVRLAVRVSVCCHLMVGKVPERVGGTLGHSLSRSACAFHAFELVLPVLTVLACLYGRFAACCRPWLTPLPPRRSTALCRVMAAAMVAVASNSTKLRMPKSSRRARAKPRYVGSMGAAIARAGTGCPEPVVTDKHSTLPPCCYAKGWGDTETGVV